MIVLLKVQLMPLVWIVLLDDLLTHHARVHARHLLERAHGGLHHEREIGQAEAVGLAEAGLRSLAQLEAQAEGLSALRDQLDTYTKRWKRALDALRRSLVA